MKIIFRLSFQTRCCLICLWSITLTSCEHHQKTQVMKSSHAVIKPVVQNEEDQIIRLVMNLDEVKRKTAQVKEASSGKRNLATYIENSPTDKDPNYWVKVAEDNGGSLVTYYTFAIDRRSHKISYYDNTKDALVPLTTWRKTTPADER